MSAPQNRALETGTIAVQKSFNLMPLGGSPAVEVLLFLCPVRGAGILPALPHPLSHACFTRSFAAVSGLTM